VPYGFTQCYLPPGGCDIPDDAIYASLGPFQSIPQTASIGSAVFVTSRHTDTQTTLRVLTILRCGEMIFPPVSAISDSRTVTLTSGFYFCQCSKVTITLKRTVSELGAWDRQTDTHIHVHTYFI